MPAIRNSSLIKRFTDFFKLKVGDGLDNEVTPLIVPTVNMPMPVKLFEIQDVSLNDSNKTLTVPTGKQWKIIYGSILLTTTATVGDRQFEIKIRNASSDVIYILRSAAVQAASLTEQYTLGQFGDVAQTVDGRHTIPIPVNCILDENFQIQVLDTSVIAPTADDLIIRIIVEEIDTTGERL